MIFVEYAIGKSRSEKWENFDLGNLHSAINQSYLKSKLKTYTNIHTNIDYNSYRVENNTDTCYFLMDR